MYIKMWIKAHTGIVKSYTGSRCNEISSQGVHIVSKEGKTDIIPVDTVILAAGMKSTAEIVESMYPCAVDVIPVGDCVRPGTIMEASSSAYFAVLDL